MIGRIHLTVFAAAASMLVPCVGPALASPTIRNEPGDPYNKPAKLPKPHMICVVGANPPQMICPARLAPPLTACECLHADSVGLRYFIAEPHRLPTVFSFDGYAR